jgi:hypothetical protein
MNPKRVQPLRNAKLVRYREVDPFTLAAVPQGRIVNLYLRIHNETGSLPAQAQNAKNAVSDFAAERLEGAGKRIALRGRSPFRAMLGAMKFCGRELPGKSGIAGTYVGHFHVKLPFLTVKAG